MTPALIIPIRDALVTFTHNLIHFHDCMLILTYFQHFTLNLVHVHADAFRARIQSPTSRNHKIILHVLKVHFVTNIQEI